MLVSIIFGAIVGGEFLPIGYAVIKIFSAWREWAVTFRDVFESNFIGCDHARFRAHLDAHVADGHAPTHGKRADRVAEIFGDICGCSCGAEFADDNEDDVFCGDAGVELSGDVDAERFWFCGCSQGLSCEDMFDFCGADSKGERGESAMGRGVAIAADDGEAGKGDPELRADDVDDALLFMAVAEERNTELFAILGKGGELFTAEGGFIDRSAVGGDVVVDGGEGEIGPADFSIVLAQAVERLGAGHFVDQVAIDVEEGAAAGQVGDDVAIPNLIEEGGRHLLILRSEAALGSGLWVRER